ncbi:putative transcription factor bHLH041 [Zea mays]|uniref:putative transcription factor bHLH041 n=1 Tax=Zea mays TaxID=4577 RepID=UPI001112D414|nr:putative transcription factor bHLH041 [Zea mays]
MELPAHDLTTSASLPVQQQFYQEAGIQMAAFMGCESGEVEIGMYTAPTSGTSPMSLESTLQQVFSEDFFQQSLLEELLQLPPTRPSSPSVSVGSPAADALTSLPRTMAATPTPSSSVERRAPPVPPPPPPHARPPVFPVPFARHGPGHVRFPSADTDDAAMAQAMIDVISGASSSSALPTPPSTATAPPPPGKHHRARRRRGAATAFRAYNAALAPRAPWRPPGVPGQRMIKMGISILRRMHMLRFSRERTGTTMAQRGQEGEDDLSSPAVPTSSQLNHMISERRRRERLNESFEALRGLLPPGSKKDKATVLAKTLDYMSILVAQIADLEAKNRSLESRAQHHHRHANGGSNGGRVVVLQGLMSGTSSSERVQVHVTAGAGDVGTSASSPSAGPPPPASREVEETVRVHARAARSDVAELVARALAAIKGMGRFTVVAVDAGRSSDGGGDFAQATFTLRATTGEFDAASLREAVAKAADDSATPPSDDS